MFIKVLKRILIFRKGRYRDAMVPRPPPLLWVPPLGSPMGSCPPGFPVGPGVRYSDLVKVLFALTAPRSDMDKGVPHVCYGDRPRQDNDKHFMGSVGLAGWVGLPKNEIQGNEKRPGAKGKK